MRYRPEWAGVCALQVLENVGSGMEYIEHADYEPVQCADCVDRLRRT